MIEAGLFVRVVAALVKPFSGWVRDNHSQTLKLDAGEGRWRKNWQLASPVLLTQDVLQGVPSADPEAIATWLLSLGAYPLGTRRDEILMQAATDHEIQLVSLEVIVEKREHSRPSAVVSNPSAGAETLTFMGVDLTEGADPTPSVVERDGGTVWTGREYLSENDFRIPPGGHERIALISQTGADLVSWRLRVGYRARRKVLHQTYPPPAQPPFVTCGMDPSVAEQLFLCGVAAQEGHPYVRQVARGDFA